MLTINNFHGPTQFGGHPLLSGLAGAHPAQIQRAVALARRALGTLPFPPASQFRPQCYRHCLPRPRIGLSGAPAGRGLTKDPADFPEGSVRTAGGYTVVPEGKTSWKIYGPNQKHSDKAMTRVWGDPHVDEKDGTRWDFTKSSDFVLPDGTRIFAKTTSETGQSITKGLTITNGADRVNIDGINGQPETGAITHDGYQWRARHLAQDPSRDTFRLGGNGEDAVHWFKERGGRQLGKVTGASYDGAAKQYVQKLDANSGYWATNNLRPPLGTPAWGNALRGQIADLIGNRTDPWTAEMLGGSLYRDHRRNQFMGGLIGHFGGYGDLFGAVGRLRHHMLMQNDLAQTALRNRLGFVAA